jgi:hypothetical protein
MAWVTGSPLGAAARTEAAIRQESRCYTIPSSSAGEAPSLS